MDESQKYHDLLTLEGSTRRPLLTEDKIQIYSTALFQQNTECYKSMSFNNRKPSHIVKGSKLSLSDNKYKTHE